MDYDPNSIANFLKVAAKESFLSLLNRIEGTKDLIISANIITLLDLICGFTVLKENGVEKIYKLEPGVAGNSSKKCFVINANLEETKCVANCINQDKQRGDSVSFFVIFVPKKLNMCENCLEQEGVFNDVSILEYPLGLIPLDYDLFSLEINHFFTDSFLNGDHTGLHHISRSINQFEKLFGKIPSLYGKGNNAEMIVDILSKLESNDSSDRDGVIKSIVLFDRDCDYASVLLSPLNYEAIMDESFTIKCGRIEFGNEVFGNAGDKSAPVKHIVHSNDPIYRDIRDAAFSSVFLSLKEKGQEMQKVKEKYEKDMNLSEMRKFITNELKSLQSQMKSLSLHISACEVIMQRKKDEDFSNQLSIEQNMIENINQKDCLSFIEENIMRQISQNVSLRLMCLLSYSNDGLSSSNYKHLVTLYLQSYGHDHCLTLFNLKKLRLLVAQNQMTSHLQHSNLSPIGITNKVTSVISTRRFRMTVKRLGLIPKTKEEVYDLKNPPDPGYVFGGTFIPVICRLVEMLLIDKHPNLEELIKCLPGRYTSINRNAITSPSPVLVFFIGGVTFAEVSALRFLAKQSKMQIFIATTSVINGNTFMKQLMPQI